MLKAIDVRDPYTVWQMANILFRSQGEDPEFAANACQYWAQQSGFPFGEITYYPATLVYPAYMFLTLAREVVVLAEGTGGVTQAMFYAWTAAVPYRNDAGEVENGTFARAAVIIAHSLEERNLLSGRSVTLVGHSYGGGVMTCLARVLSDILPREDLQLLTFGAPRAGDAGFCSKVARVVWERYMGPSDPVPFLPPHEDETPTGLIRGARWLAVGAGDWEQSGHGIVIWPDGRTAVAAYPPHTPVQQEEFWWAYTRKLIDAAATSHSFSNYVLACRNRFAAIKRAQPELAPPAEKRPEKPPEARVVVVVSTAFGGNPMVGKIPVYYRPRRFRQSPTKWGVTWLGFVVWKNISASTAKANIRKLTLWLCRIPVDGVFDSAAFLQAVSTFLYAAQAGGSDWSPNMWPIV